MSGSVIARLHEVIGSVLGAKPQDLTDDDSPQTLPSWDSVAHLQLIMALEAEFGIEFSPEEIGELGSVGEIRQRVEERTGGT